MTNTTTIPPCDNCGEPNHRHLSGNYCEVCSESYRARVRIDPETQPVGHVCLSVTAADGNGAFCSICGETLA